MEKNDNIKKPVNKQALILSILLILAGLILLSLNFGWIEAPLVSVIFSWAMLLIVMGYLILFTKDKISGFIILIVGIFFLLPRLQTSYPETFSWISPDFVDNMWPVLLIILGVIIFVQVMLNANKRHKMLNRGTSSQTVATEGVIDKSVVFGGSKSIFLEPVFNGGCISAIFGGVEIDLSKTTLPEGDTYLNVNAIFGGIVLYVPDDLQVVTNLSNFFGGVDDKRSALHSAKQPKRLIIEGSLIFSGCELR
ncbi:MAG: LiaF domain-containing protein [Fermentimonas sp.]|jgi:predicted membrane protein